MAAVACLRVAVDAERTGLSPVSLGPLVSKFVASYLETRWLWPRKFELLTHYAFLLTDPRTDQTDIRELAPMSDELQARLFAKATDGGGEVALLLFEGTPEAARAFAELSVEALGEALEDPERLPAGGRLTRLISPGAVGQDPEVLRVPLVDEAEASVAAGALAAKPVRLPALEGAQGVYFTPRGLFVGDVISSTPGSSRIHYSLADGPDHMPENTAAFDADCVIAAMRFLTEGVKAMLYLPVCYSNIIKPTQRRDYERILSVLPERCRGQLAAAVYDVPRDPAFGALTQVKEMLTKYVASIDLRTPDPGFEIEKLAHQAVTSVTLVLPDAEPRVRLAALRRFIDRYDLYRRKQVWPAVTNIRSRAELEACTAAKIPFVTGPAVCRMQSLPVGGRMQSMAELPVRAA